MIPSFILVLAISSILGPILISQTIQPAKIESVLNCQEGTEKLDFRIYRGFLINLVRNKAISITRVPFVRREDFISNIDYIVLHYEPQLEGLNEIPAGNSIIFATDLTNPESNRPIFLVATTEEIMKWKEVMQICASKIIDANTGRFYITKSAMDAESLETKALIASRSARMPKIMELFLGLTIICVFLESTISVFKEHRQVLPNAPPDRLGPRI